MSWIWAPEQPRCNGDGCAISVECARLADPAALHLSWVAPEAPGEDCGPYLPLNPIIVDVRNVHDVKAARSKLEQLSASALIPGSRRRRLADAFERGLSGFLKK